MADLLHHSAGEESHDPAVVKHNARLGLILFAVYLSLYAAYVLINAFVPSWMDVRLLGGLNTATASGLGLIVGAVVLAVVYLILCRAPRGSRM